MSAPPHKFWPKVGSVWATWYDLLLATQLAALRAGFSGVIRGWTPSLSRQLRVECSAYTSKPNREVCKHRVLAACAVDPEEPTKQWQVVEVRADHLDASSHPVHRRTSGTSHWLKKRPSSSSALRPGDKIVGGRFISAHVAMGRRRADNDATAEHAPFTFTCHLGTGRCSFFVRLRSLAVDEDAEPRWECVEIRKEHSCASWAKRPRRRLLRRMAFFPSIHLEDGCVGKKAQRVGFRGTSKAYVAPPDIPDTAALLSSPVPASSPSVRLNSLSRRLTRLLTAKASISSARATLERLTAELDANEKRVTAQLERVKKKRRRLQRKVELEEERKKVEKKARRRMRRQMGKMRVKKDKTRRNKDGIEVIELE